MKSAPHLAAPIALLAAELPVEDIWYFAACQAPECELPQPFHLVLLVSDDAEAHQVEERAAGLLGDRRRDFAVHAFPHRALYQLPRPLLLKMAMTAGRCVFQR
mgnify:CR=1 FL=1|jgi:hypothetical protein